MSELISCELSASTWARASSPEEFGELLLERGLEALGKILEANDFPSLPEEGISTFEDLYFRALLNLDINRRKVRQLKLYLSSKCLQPHIYGAEAADNPFGEEFGMEYATEPLYEAMAKKIIEAGEMRIPEEVRQKLKRDARALDRYLSYKFGFFMGRSFPQTAAAIAGVLSKIEPEYTPPKFR